MRRKLVESRAEAQRAIDAGLVRVAGNPQPKASTLVAPADPVHLTAPPEPFVSRAGRKLDRALTVFPVSVEGRRAIDLGASTGGFTDCLLQRGASEVVAVDVGYGQMHLRIRDDPRVVVIERTNIRTADPQMFEPPFDIVVGDLSFISLTLLTEQIRAYGDPTTDWLLLIKPQFEAGREEVGKGGVIRDHAVRADAVERVVSAFGTVGLRLHGLDYSPITGSAGNVEYLAWFRTAPAPESVTALIEALGEVPA